MHFDSLVAPAFPQAYVVPPPCPPTFPRPIQGSSSFPRWRFQRTHREGNILARGAAGTALRHNWIEGLTYGQGEVRKFRLFPSEASEAWATSLGASGRHREETKERKGARWREANSRALLPRKSLCHPGDSRRGEGEKERWSRCPLASVSSKSEE